MIVSVCCKECVKHDVIVRYILIPISVPASYLEVWIISVTKDNSVRNNVLRIPNEKNLEALNGLRNVSVDYCVQELRF